MTKFEEHLIDAERSLRRAKTEVELAGSKCHKIDKVNITNTLTYIDTTLHCFKEAIEALKEERNATPTV